MRNLVISLGMVIEFSSGALAQSGAPFDKCLDAQSRFKVYDYRQTGEYTANVLAQVDGENFSLFCGLNNDPADAVPIACAGYNGDLNVSLRVHQKPTDRPRAAVIGIRARGEGLDINSVVPLVCE